LKRRKKATAPYPHDMSV